VEAVFVFSDKTTDALIQAGWAVPRARTDGTFATHSDKVKTYQAVAIALGYSAQVGVLQANFGGAKSGVGPEGDWRDVNLDLNGDGIVDQKDLRLAGQGPSLQ
jgi:hypothetical protein